MTVPMYSSFFIRPSTLKQRTPLSISRGRYSIMQMSRAERIAVPRSPSSMGMYSPGRVRSISAYVQRQG